MIDLDDLFGLKYYWAYGLGRVRMRLALDKPRKVNSYSGVEFSRRATFLDNPGMPTERRVDDIVGVEVRINASQSVGF